MASSTNALHKSLNALFRDYKDQPDFLPYWFGMAPQLRSSRNGEFLIPTSATRLDMANRPQVASESADFIPAAFDFDRIDYSVRRIAGHYVVLPNDVIHDLEEGVDSLDLIGYAIRAVTRPIFGELGLQFYTEAANLNAGTAFDSTDPGYDIVTAFNTNIRTIELATGDRPNTLLLGREVADALKTFDQVQEGVAMASSASDFRRSGAIDDGHLEAWFRDKLRLDLIVDSTSVTSVGGADNWLNDGSYAYMAVTRENNAPGAFKTLTVNTPDRSGELVDFYVRETSGAQAIGWNVLADSRSQVKLVDPKRGLKIATTI